VLFLAYLAYLGAVAAGLITIFWLARRQQLPSGLRPGKDISIGAFVALGLSMVIFVALSFKLSCPPDRWDFLHAYYPAGVAALHGDSEMLKGLIGRGTTGFVNIPIVAYLFAPFALVSPEVASAAITGVGVVLLILTWFMLVRAAQLKLRERWILGLLFLANGPLIHAVKLGNLSYFVLSGLVGGLLLLRKGRPGAAGVLLAVATIIKPPLALFGFFFLFRRNWRGLMAYSTVGILTVGLSLLVYGWADNLYWFQTAIVQYSHKWLAAFNVQSVPAFILRLGPDAKLSEWLISESPSWGQKLFAQIGTLILLCSTFWACFRWPLRLDADRGDREDVQRDLQYLLVICLSVVSSPLSWSHYYLWLLIPAAYFLRAWAAGEMPRHTVRAGWLAIAFLTPVIGLPLAMPNPILKFIYQSLILSHILFGGLIMFGVITCWLAAKRGNFSPILKPNRPTIKAELGQ
jgi:alpha-1,2-mannosyltransferase